jgi:hypothetical protein
MKTDKLEKFIRDNRESFDEHEPSPELWDKINKPESKGRIININWKSYASKAAAVVVIFISSYYFHEYRSNRKANDVAENTNSAIENDPLYKDLIEAEFYYTAQIDERKNELFMLAGNTPGLKKEVNIELEDLDAIFRELKEDLKDNAYNQEVVEAMIQNYMLKLEILEDILNQIKSSQEKNDIHEQDNYI